MEDRNIFAAEEYMVLDVEEIGEVDVTAGVPVIWHITVGLMVCLTTQELTEGLQQKAKIRTQFGATRCWGENETAPDR